jgi:hypothetical protein
MPDDRVVRCAGCSNLIPAVIAYAGGEGDVGDRIPVEHDLGAGSFCPNCVAMATHDAPTPEGAMGPGHPRWEEFLDRLGGPEGCDVRTDGHEDFKWRCGGGMDKTFAKAILERMNENGSDQQIDVALSLEFFELRGGHCDCEILLNVAAVL